MPKHARIDARRLSLLACGLPIALALVSALSVRSLLRRAATDEAPTARLSLDDAFMAHLDV